MPRKAKEYKFIPPKDIACKGAGRARKPARKIRGLPNVCFAVRAEGTGSQKTHATEVFSGKDGKSLGFIGPNCSLVPSRDLAVKSDHLNRYQAEDRLMDCIRIMPWNRDQVRRFRGALKAARAR